MANIFIDTDGQVMDVLLSPELPNSSSPSRRTDYDHATPASECGKEALFSAVL